MSIALRYSSTSQSGREMQIDPGRLDRHVPGLGLDRLQRHPGLPQPGETGMPQLVAGRVDQPGPAAGAGEDLVDPAADNGRPRRGPFNTTNT